MPHVEGLPVETALFEPGMAGGRVPDGYGMVTVHATGAYGERAQRLPDETLEKELLDALERIQPGARATVDFTRLFRTGAARPRFDVGHYRRLRRYRDVESERLSEGLADATEEARPDVCHPPVQICFHVAITTVDRRHRHI